MPESDKTDSIEQILSVELNKLRTAVDDLRTQQTEQYDKVVQQSKRLARRIHKLSADVSLVASGYRENSGQIVSMAKAHEGEMKFLERKIEDRDRRLSTIEKKVDVVTQEDTEQISEYWKFVAESKSLYEHLKAGVDKLVTREYCDKVRAECAANKVTKKKWYEFAPTLVSIITLILLLGGGFVWMVRGPASIDPAMASDLNKIRSEWKQLVQDTKLKAKFDNMDKGKE